MLDQLERCRRNQPRVADGRQARRATPRDLARRAQDPADRAMPRRGADQPRRELAGDGPLAPVFVLLAQRPDRGPDGRADRPWMAMVGPGQTEEGLRAGRAIARQPLEEPPPGAPESGPDLRGRLTALELPDRQSPQRDFDHRPIPPQLTEARCSEDACLTSAR